MSTQRFKYLDQWEETKLEVFYWCVHCLRRRQAPSAIDDVIDVLKSALQGKRIDSVAELNLDPGQ